jgi:hypothetical protein
VAEKRFSDSVERACAVVINYYRDSTVKVGTKAKEITPYYTIDATIQKDSLQINNVSFTDSQYVRFVVLKGGLLKRDQNHKLHLFLKKSMQVQILHTNPKMHVTGSNSVIYTPKVKSRWFEKLVLIGTGVYLGTKL